MEEDFEKRILKLREKLELTKKGEEELKELKKEIEELKARQDIFSKEFEEAVKGREEIVVIKNRIEKLERALKELISILEEHTEVLIR